jgi:signal transduction histidine kinase
MDLRRVVAVHGSTSTAAAVGRPRPGLTTTVPDVCLALALAVLGLPEALVGPGPWLLSMFLDVALIPPLIWRRRSPTLAFSAISAVAFARWVTGPHAQFGNHRLTAYHLVADIALLVSFYTVASRESRWRTIAAAVVLELALLLATVHWAGGENGPALFVLLSGTAAAAGVSGNNARTRRAYLASVEERAATLEIERDHQARLAAAGERARIARDMHDVVAHNLSVMISLADGASYAAGADPQRAADAMNQVAATGRQALGEMRRLLGVLREGDEPVALQPQPNLADLDSLVAQVRLTGLRASLVTEGALHTLPPGLQLAVYRMVQEALTNTLKHALDAETAIVRLRLDGRRLEVDVIDDGSPPRSGAPAGHGITGMRERADVYGGEVEAGPRAGQGWRVHAHFDLGTRELVP